MGFLRWFGKVRIQLLHVIRAFNMVDHNILIMHLRISYGIAGRPVDCFCSFVNGRTMMVTISSDCTAWIPVQFAFPIDSVLGLHLYILYTVVLAWLITAQRALLREHGFSWWHANIRYMPSNWHSCSGLLHRPLWRKSSNRVRLNLTKTQYIWLHTIQSWLLRKRAWGKNNLSSIFKKSLVS